MSSVVTRITIDGTRVLIDGEVDPRAQALVYLDGKPYALISLERLGLEPPDDPRDLTILEREGNEVVISTRPLTLVGAQRIDMGCA